MNHYFPPLKNLLEELGITADQLKSGSLVRIPAPILRYLITCSLRGLAIDCGRYLEKNSDVEKEYGNQRDGNVHDHFCNAGYFEGRGVPLPFDEQYYLAANPDVQQAINNKSLKGARQHFEETGIYERRAPSRAANLDLALWLDAGKK